MEEVLTYPLTPIPVSLCHIDGKMSKTTKSTIMKELEKSKVLYNPEMPDVVIVKGMLFLDLLTKLSETFGFVSRSMLRKLCSSFSAKGIDNVFDKVVTPPIKENERHIQAHDLARHAAYEILTRFRNGQPIFLKLYAITHTNKH